MIKINSLVMSTGQGRFVVTFSPSTATDQYDMVHCSLQLSSPVERLIDSGVCVPEVDWVVFSGLTPVWRETSRMGGYVGVDGSTDLSLSFRVLQS